jgi:hypothetical protein
MASKESRLQSTLEQRREKRRERQKRYRERLTIRRRGELINLKYIRGLTIKEQAELTRLDAALDKMDAPFYDAMIQRLRTLTQGQIDKPQRSKPEKLFSRIHSGRIVYISGEGKARTKKIVFPHG